MFENEKENFFYWLSNKLEQHYQRKTLAKLFFIGLIGNIFSWFTAFFAPHFVGKFITTLIDLEGKIGIYLLIIPFSFAFLMAFSILKMRAKQFENFTNGKKEFFNNYFENLRASDYRIIFLFSAMFGGINSLTLVFAIITFY